MAYSAVRVTRTRNSATRIVQTSPSRVFGESAYSCANQSGIIWRDYGATSQPIHRVTLIRGKTNDREPLASYDRSRNFPHNIRANETARARLMLVHASAYTAEEIDKEIIQIEKDKERDRERERRYISWRDSLRLLHTHRKLLIAPTPVSPSNRSPSLWQISMAVHALSYVLR